MNSPARSPAEAPAATPNFDRLAWVYRWMEACTFGPWLGWCRCAFLPEMAQAGRALTFGDGDGRFTAKLLAANPVVHVDAVDGSPKMLQALRRRAGGHGNRLRTEVADARAWLCHGDAERPYDLVYTHFFLDCLTGEDVRGLAARVRPLLADDGLWVVSEFAVPPGWFGRLVARPVVGFLYWAFGLLTGLRIRRLPDYAAALRAAGFTLKQRRSRLLGLLVSEIWMAAGNASGAIS